MKNKIIGIFVVTLMIASVFPTMGTSEKNIYMEENDQFTIPSELIDDGHFCGCEDDLTNSESDPIINWNQNEKNETSIESELKEIRKAIEDSNTNWTAGHTSVSALSHSQRQSLCGAVLEKDKIGETIFFDDQLDQDQPLCGDYGYMIFDGSWLAQSFRPSLERLTRVKVYLVKYGNPSGSLKLSVRSSLSGADLTFATKSSSQISTVVNWVEFDFSDITVTVDQTYYIVCRTTGGNEDNCYLWGFYEENPYSRGILYGSVNSGSTWESDRTEDFTFKTYGQIGEEGGFSWRNKDGKDWTTSIKNQGDCGSCMAFGAVGAVETIVHIKDGNPWGCDLSEAHLFFCCGGTCDEGTSDASTIKCRVKSR